MGPKAATPARKEPPPQATNTPMPPPSMAFKQEITEEPKGVVPPELQHTVEARDVVGRRGPLPAPVETRSAPVGEVPDFLADSPPAQECRIPAAIPPPSAAATTTVSDKADKHKSSEAAAASASSSK